VNEFLWPARVYYEDTDSGGVVYHSNYLNFMERARTEWLRSKGFELDQLHDQGTVFVVRSMQIEFKSPARFNQLLETYLCLVNIGKASMVLEQEIKNTSDPSAQYPHQVNQNPGKLLVSAKVKLACIDTNNFRPRSIPDAILKEIK